MMYEVCTNECPATQKSTEIAKLTNEKSDKSVCSINPVKFLLLSVSLIVKSLPHYFSLKLIPRGHRRPQSSLIFLCSFSPVVENKIVNKKWVIFGTFIILMHT